MNTKVKIKLIGQDRSQGRGVGFYHNFLEEALKASGEVELVKKNYDLVHYTFFDLFLPTLPLVKFYPTVVTIHDLTPLVLEKLYPQGPKAKLSLFHQRLSLQNTKLIITDSENSKADIYKLFSIPKEKIFVTPLAVDPQFSKSITKSELAEIKNRYHLPDHFVLTVAAGPNPNKNLPLLAKVTEKLNLPLVIVGSGVSKPLPVGKIHAELRDLESLKAYKHIYTPGFVPTPQLSGFYKLAYLYCQPSLYEGFGLPLLEAMSAGCLTVSSNRSSLPEVYPADTITFDPSSESSLAKALTNALHLSSSQKEKLISQAKDKSHDFSWQKTASLTIQAYQKVLQG